MNSSRAGEWVVGPEILSEYTPRRKKVESRVPVPSTKGKAQCYCYKLLVLEESEDESLNPVSAIPVLLGRARNTTVVPDPSETP